jgi:archaeosine synthase
LVEILRLFDKDRYQHQELRFPITGKRFNATTRLSLGRPDVVRFRERILSRYRKPATPSILVLLPCSARKPYSESKSHGFFRRAIKESGANVLVHELIVTSPLGLVPRELELFYPAQHYDIPVTGHWYEEERTLINSMLKEYIKNNNYDILIDHFGGEGFIYEVEVVRTVDKHPTSDESLANLKDRLKVFKAGKEGKDWKTRTLEELSSSALFQFGDKAEGWLDGCTVKGRYPQLRLFKGKEQFASLSPSSGQLIPTLCGAEILAQKETYTVHIHDFKLTTNLFAVGVKGADPDIRAGDEVVIVRDGELVGAGTAQMPAAEMVESDRGEAVRVRHRLK